MLSLQDEMKLFKKKSISTYELPLNDLHSPLFAVETRMNSIDKTNKKNGISMELSTELLKEELEDKKKAISALNRKITDKENMQEKFSKKVLIILDQIDSVYRFAIQSQNEALINNINSLMKIIRKELREIEFEEIPTIGEIFNSELHECVEAIDDKTKDKYEIIDVIKKGYKINGKVIRIASVIAVK